VPENSNASLLPAIQSGAILTFHFGHGALSAAQNFLSIKVGLRGLTRVRNEVFARLQQLSLRFHQGANSGDLIYRASWDTYAFQTLFQQGLITFATAFLSLLLMIFVMAKLNGRLTLVALALVPLLMLAIKIFGKRMSRRAAAAQQSDSKVTSLVQQSIASMQLIQSYTREDFEKERFGEQVFAAENRRISQHGFELLYWFSLAILFGLGATAITWLGAKEVLANRLSVGELLIFLAYLAQLYEPLNQLSHGGATVSGASAGTRRVFEILDTREVL
jgi:ATP-binding cassette subfamily B protein/subfamily B ATP-binding cassette protein MsbA